MGKLEELLKTVDAQKVREIMSEFTPDTPRDLYPTLLWILFWAVQPSDIHPQQVIYLPEDLPDPVRQALKARGFTLEDGVRMGAPVVVVRL
jgi:hypothetical protein